MNVSVCPYLLICCCSHVYLITYVGLDEVGCWTYHYSHIQYRRKSQVFFSVSFSLVIFHSVALFYQFYCIVIPSSPHKRTQLAQKEYFHFHQLESFSTFGCQHQKIEMNDTGLFSVFLKLIELWQSCRILLHQLKHFWAKSILYSFKDIICSCCIITSIYKAS